MRIVDKIEALGLGNKSHAGWAFPTSVLRRLEELMPENMAATAETGCGKSTILFSNLSKHHSVFCIDDTKEKDHSSINFFKKCKLTKNNTIELVLGPTQRTLPVYSKFKKLDAVLIDGPHGYPFPEMEYYFFYPHIKTGGLLIIDDVHIASIGRFADIVAEDEMFEFVELVSTTVVLRRTAAPLFDPTGDGWWLQNYNKRRITGEHESLQQYRLNDGRRRESFGKLFGQDNTGEPFISSRDGQRKSYFSRLFS